MYRLGIKWFCLQGKTELKKVIHRVQKKQNKNKTRNQKTAKLPIERNSKSFMC